MATVFDTLSSELIIQVARNLDITALGSLRVVSKSAARLFDQEFRRHISHRRVFLTKDGLRRLGKLAASTNLRSAIRVLDLICLQYEEWRLPFPRGFTHPGYPRPPPEHELWISERIAEQDGFSGEDMCTMLTVALHSFGELSGIRLDTMVAQDRDQLVKLDNVHFRNCEEKVWARAIQAYRVVMSALARSRICLDSLHIYWDTKKIGIPIEQVVLPLARLEEENFILVGQHLKSFSIRLATPIQPAGVENVTADAEFYSYETILLSSPYLPQSYQDGSVSDGATDAKAVARFLHLMPNLGSLHLHLYTTVSGEPYQAFLSSLLPEIRHQHLQDITLRGFRMTEDVLQHFLLCYPHLHSLTLEHIDLISGSWPSIFLMLSQAQELEHVRLADLWIPGKHLQTIVDLKPWRTRPEISDIAAENQTLPIGSADSTAWCSRDFSKTELRSGLDFQGTTIVSGGMASYRDYRRFKNWLDEYGPAAL